MFLLFLEWVPKEGTKSIAYGQKCKRVLFFLCCKPRVEKNRKSCTFFFCCKWRMEKNVTRVLFFFAGSSAKKKVHEFHFCAHLEGGGACGQLWLCKPRDIGQCSLYDTKTLGMAALDSTALSCKVSCLFSTGPLPCKGYIATLPSCGPLLIFACRSLVLVFAAQSAHLCSTSRSTCIAHVCVCVFSVCVCVCVP